MRGPARFAPVLLAVAATVVAPSAGAQELVIATFGGSFADDSKSCHIEPFEKKTGAKSAVKLGNSAQYAAAVRATKGGRIRRRLHRQLACDPVEEREPAREDRQDKLTNAADVSPQAFDKDDSYVVFMTGATVIAYNPKQCHDAADLLAGPLRAGVRRHASPRRHHRHVRPAVPARREPDERRHAREHRPRLHGDQAARQDVRHALHPGRPDRLAARARRDRHRALVHRTVPASAADKGVPVARRLSPKEGAVGILPDRRRSRRARSKRAGPCSTSTCCSRRKARPASPRRNTPGR